jgi:hypothetical protein
MLSNNDLRSGLVVVLLLGNGFTMRAQESDLPFQGTIGLSGVL